MKERGGRGGGLGRLPGEGGPAWQEIKHQSINRCEPGDPTAAGLRRRQRDPRGAGGRQGRGRWLKTRRVAGGSAAWPGPRAGRRRTDGREPSAARSGGRGRWAGAPGASGLRGPGSGPAPRGGSRARPPRPAPRRTRPGAEAAATRQALVAASPGGGADPARRRRPQLPPLGALLSAPSTFDFGDRRAIASPTHRLRPPPGASAPPSNFSRRRSAPPPRGAQRSGPAAPPHARARPLLAQSRHRRGSRTMARLSQTAGAPALPAGLRGAQEQELCGGRRAGGIPG